MEKNKDEKKKKLPVSLVNILHTVCKQTNKWKR